MARRRQTFVIASQSGTLSPDYSSRRDVERALANEVKEQAARCRRAHKRCAVVGSAKRGDVEIRIGGRQGYNLWDRYVINKR